MGRTAFRGYFPAFAFFLPTFAPLCLRAFLALSPLRRLLLTPPRDGIPCPSPPFPDRGRAEHGVPPAWVECTGDCLGDSGRLCSPRQPARRGVCAVHLAHFHQPGAADLLILSAAARRFRPPASTSHAALHPPNGHLRPPVRMTPHPPSSPRRRRGGSAQPPEPWRWGRDELKLAKAPLPGAPNVVVCKPTAGWRSAPV